MSTPRATRAQVAARRTKACDLRTAGYSWEDIAAALGYTTRGAACQDVGRAYTANREDAQEAAESLRDQELVRLDALWRHAWEVMKRPHLHISAGKVVVIEDQQTGEEITLYNDKPGLEAIDRLLRIAERRATLLGLDAPTKISTDGQVRYIIEGVDLDKL
jgi:hypothetical protein